MTSFRQAMTSFSFCQVMANLQTFGSRILDAWSIKLISLLTITFYLTNNQNRTKKSRTEPSYYYKIKVFLVLKDISEIYFWNTNRYFWNNILVRNDSCVGEIRRQNDFFQANMYLFMYSLTISFYLAKTGKMTLSDSIIR